MLRACFASCVSACDCCCTFLCVKLRLPRRTRRRHRRHHRHHQRNVDMEAFDHTSSTEAEDDHDEDGETSFALRDYNHDMDKENSGSLSRRRKDYRGDQLRKSLRPRSHRIGARISRDLGHGNRRNPIKCVAPNQDPDHHDHKSRFDHAIRVTRTSKFVRKGTIYKGGVQRRRRRLVVEG